METSVAKKLLNDSWEGTGQDVDSETVETASMGSASSENDFCTACDPLEKLWWADCLPPVEQAIRIHALRAVCEQLLRLAPAHRPRTSAAFANFSKRARSVAHFMADPREIARILQVSAHVMKRVEDQVWLEGLPLLLRPCERLPPSIHTAWSILEKLPCSKEADERRLKWLYSVAREPVVVPAEDIMLDLCCVGLANLTSESLQLTSLSQRQCDLVLPYLGCQQNTEVTLADVQREVVIPRTLVGAFLGRDRQELEQLRRHIVDLILESSLLRGVPIRAQLRMLMGKANASTGHRTLCMQLRASSWGRPQHPDLEVAVDCAEKAVHLRLTEIMLKRRQQNEAVRKTRADALLAVGIAYHAARREKASSRKLSSCWHLDRALRLPANGPFISMVRAMPSKKALYRRGLGQREKRTCLLRACNQLQERAKHQGSCWSAADALEAAKCCSLADAQAVKLLGESHLQMVPVTQVRGKAARVQRQALCLAKSAGLVHQSNPQRVTVKQPSRNLRFQNQRRPRKPSTIELLQDEEWNILR